MSKSTPMMEQYLAVKRQNPGCLLFFRLGDFYELFGDDAVEASRVLNITLTARSSGEGRSVKVPMAGVPYHAAPTYIQKLLKAGKKVAICEQVGSPQGSKGMMRRELVRVITPGTALEDAFLEGKSNNYIAALYRGKSSMGLAAADNTTGDFFAEEVSQGELEAELARLRPAEILLPDSESGSDAAADFGTALCSPVDSYTFSALESSRVLKEHFGLMSLEGFGFREDSPALQAAGALLAYLKKTQFSQLSHLTQLQQRELRDTMRLDASTQRHLELSANQEDGGRSGTLLEVLDRCNSAAGSRLLKRWIHAPLMDLTALQGRQDAVSELLESALLRKSLQERLRATTDLERAVGRVGCLAASARDLASVRQTLREVPGLRAALGPCKSALLRDMAWPQALQDLAALLDRAVVEEPPFSIRDGGMIRSGYSPELDAIVADSHGGRDLVLAVQENERKASANPKLKVQFNQVFGFYIEVSKAQSGQVPAHFERKQTLVNAERFTTPELKAIEARVLSADERRKELELALFKGLRGEIAQCSQVLLQLAQSLARLDCLLSLADAAHELGYVRPELSDEVLLDIEAGRHPVVEYLMRARGSQAFVSNPCHLDAQDQQMMLITGPNMAGKSTYMRQVALIAIMAQMGSFVPAKRARIGLVDRLFTRVGASDRLNKGMSTFLVEMTETANILRNATRRSLVVLDEIGRGTSTFDGVSIAWAVAEHLHQSKDLGCRTLFATHYFELCELEQKFPRIRNYSVAVREWEHKIVFMHEIRPGSSEHSYGIAVARLAGVPEAVLRTAVSVLATLETGRGGPQIELFPGGEHGPGSELADALAALDPDALSPMQALQWIAQWRERLTAKASAS
jgi:DNA mismatch repair protein MutS